MAELVPDMTADGRAGAVRYRDLYPLRPAPLIDSDSFMPSIISIKNLSKSYASGFRALKDINLDIRRGEIFALLGPNGAGKTTLIGIVCGILKPTEGSVTVDGHDIIDDYRAARSLIGLVPQELPTDAFESVWATVSFSRGLWVNRGKMPDEYLEFPPVKTLADLSSLAELN